MKCSTAKPSIRANLSDATSFKLPENLHFNHYVTGGFMSYVTVGFMSYVTVGIMSYVTLGFMSYIYLISLFAHIGYNPIEQHNILTI